MESGWRTLGVQAVRGWWSEVDAAFFLEVHFFLERRAAFGSLNTMAESDYRHLVFRGMNTENSRPDTPDFIGQVDYTKYESSLPQHQPITAIQDWLTKQPATRHLQL
jgi:hypothetical protein